MVKVDGVVAKRPELAVNPEKNEIIFAVQSEYFPIYLN